MAFSINNCKERGGIDFFFKLREYRVPCTVRELLDLISAMKERVIFCSVDDFYVISRVILVKDESHFDKFDRAFADYFKVLFLAC